MSIWGTAHRKKAKDQERENGKCKKKICPDLPYACEEIQRKGRETPQRRKSTARWPQNSSQRLTVRELCPAAQGRAPDDQKPQEAELGTRRVQSHAREAYKHREPRLTERNAFTSRSCTRKALSKVPSDSASSYRVSRLITPSCPFYFMSLFVKIAGHSSPCWLHSPPLGYGLQLMLCWA